MTWSDLRSVLDDGKSFLITSHLSPDGDSIGSQLAMQWYLASMGKQAFIYQHDPIPHKLAFLDEANVIASTRPEGEFDVLIVLDSSNPVRVGWPDPGLS